ncbi:MAG: ribonuclease HII [Lachnospiraceae bacterium]|uniref:Ribonuclease HII n=1 Tax=Candidatus Weimeria bifida TaxID=2599074 RepID=A0A6N7IXX9_9FIRM|nr:ribonuclease HII [Candidatus Weimeria bifida]RRF96107.1 MAG: ribonuclease HII [Lachnospiraceae bacterium]
MTQREEKERERVKSLYETEDELHRRGIEHVGGIDEAGRGPLAGPVVAACVILKPDVFIDHLNDSKKLSEKRREEVFKDIVKNAVSIGVGLADVKEIDEINILQADYMAMKRAIFSMKVKPDFIVNDAVKIPGVDIEQLPKVKADATVAAVSAASVIAKVTRDHIMKVYDEKVPEYGFAKNKAYGTKAHYQAIEKYGILPIHRRSFLTKRIEAGKLSASENNIEFEDPRTIMDTFLKEYGLPD